MMSFFYSLLKILLVFIFEIGSEYTLADILQDFCLAPKTTAIQFFLARLDLAIIDATMHIHQFFLSLALKDIMPHGYRFEVCDTEFLSHLP